MDRKWIVLVALLALGLVLGACPKEKPAPPTPPPKVVDQAPATDVTPVTDPGPPMDSTEMAPEKSIQELEDEARQAGLLGDVFYDFDKYELRPEARERLEKNAVFMKENQGLTFTIEGHCDERGTNEYNLALGQRRSTAALDFLVSLGIGRSRFKTISYGEEKPFCTESTEACWQKNRRARFVITGRI